MTPDLVLIVDDNPEHLKIYGLIVAQAGYQSIQCLARPSGIDLPEDAGISLTLLDYHLNCPVPCAEIARRIKAGHPAASILLLSDALGMPVEMASLVDGFVRKGDPRKLVATLRLLAGEPETKDLQRIP